MQTSTNDKGRVDVERCEGEAAFGGSRLGRGARIRRAPLARPVALLLVALAAAGCGAAGGSGEDTGRRGSGMRTDDLPMSENIEDRRNWQDLGYDSEGNGYSQDSVTGDVFMQPWQPSDTGDGYAPGWGDPQKIDQAPDNLTAQPPEAGENGEPVWDGDQDNSDSGDGADGNDGSDGSDGADSGDDSGDDGGAGDDGSGDDGGGDGGYDDGGGDDGGDDGGGDY